MQQQQQLNQQYKAQQQPVKNENDRKSKYSQQAIDDDIQEEIADDVPDLHMKNRDPLANSDNMAMSGGISSSGANAIDHSIDTLQLD